MIGQAFPFWLMFKVAEGEYKDGIYFNYKEQLATEKVADLKRLVKANPYTRFWRDRKGTSDGNIDFLVDWGNGPIAEVTLKGAGIMSATRGRHPKFTICDDILSDFSNPVSSSELKLINRIFRNAIMSLPANEDDVLCLIGTPQSYDDILYQLSYNSEWLWLVYPAVKNWATREVQWPEKFDYSRLMRIRKSVTPSAFEVEYQLTPITVTEQFFGREDLIPIIDPELKQWNLEQEFVNPDKLGIYGGLDVGKDVHPSHVILLLELPEGDLITLYQSFMDHMSYPQQVRRLNFLAERFGLTRGYFDKTNNVLADRGLNRRWIGKPFTKRLKANMATLLEKRVFAEEDEPGLVLPNDDRFINQIVAVKNDLTADETIDGHGDSFWSLALAVQAADHGPSIVDMGHPAPQSSAILNRRKNRLAAQLGGQQ